MASSPFTLFVASCDKFEDTWGPFFTLLKANGGQGLATDGVVLSNETKDYAFDGFDIRASKANRATAEPIPWSARMIDALEGVSTDLVLYMQDDYFVETPIDTALVNALAEKMQADPSIRYIGLTHQGNGGPFAPTEDERLWRVGPRANYRISTQAGLWRKETLLSYLRPDENVWCFEIYGMRRAWKRDELFLTVNRDRPEPIRYTLTGIIKGRWHRAMPALFARYGIPMDFEKRGFYDAPPTLLRKWETFRKLLSEPGKLLAGMRGL